jgi:HSP20 family protein
MPQHEPEIQTPEKTLAPARRGWSLMNLQGEIDRLFDDFARGLALPVPGGGLRMSEPLRRLAPEPTMPVRVNVSESDNAYEIEAELPGVDEKDVDVTVSDGILTISGEIKEAKEEKRKDYRIVERAYGAFRRSFALPENVEEDKIEAKFSKGILRVTLPKRQGQPNANEKKIEVKSS